MEIKWLKWAQQIQALAQSGLAYSNNKYDIERFEQLRALSVEIMQEYTEAGAEKIKDLFCFETGYQTPKVDIRGAVIKDNQILLVKESIDGCWSMPGGWADIQYSVQENIIKEAREEAGIKVTPTKLVGIFDCTKKQKRPDPFAIYKIIMLCHNGGGSFVTNIETEDAAYFDKDRLPDLSVYRTTSEMIDFAFQAKEDPDYTPIID